MRMSNMNQHEIRRMLKTLKIGQSIRLDDQDIRNAAAAANKDPFCVEANKEEVAEYLKTLANQGLAQYEHHHDVLSDVYTFHRFS